MGCPATRLSFGRVVPNSGGESHSTCTCCLHAPLAPEHVKAEYESATAVDKSAATTRGICMKGMRSMKVSGGSMKVAKGMKAKLKDLGKDKVKGMKAMKSKLRGLGPDIESGPKAAKAKGAKVNPPKQVMKVMKATAKAKTTKQGMKVMKVMKDTRVTRRSYMIIYFALTPLVLLSR